MTSAHPTDFRPVVALLCTRGMEAFLSNAIQGILQAGIDASQIYVGCPNNALRSVKSVTRPNSGIQVISTEELSENEAEMENYSSFGSRSFTDISWKKIFFIRHLLELHPHVIYTDLDIAWIRNPLPYLSQVASVYPIAIQTEALPRFPPALCLGFASFARSERAIAFLDALIEFHSTQVNSNNRLDDQVACQRLIENDVTWLQDIYCLPEALFLNGLGYRSLQNTGESPCPMEGELVPFLFHANWTIGINNKRKLLAHTGTWLLGDISQNDQTTTACGASTEIASDIKARAETPPVLTVIYPVFDVRADVIEGVRRWAEQQDLDKHLYCVFVVVGSQTQLDESALRKVLRRQDALLRVPGAGREADYWNAGSRAAKTPWLLFIEAHGVPERDSLSALAAWIAANPDGGACNFRIANPGEHRVATKRRLAEIQAGWATPSWRRLHRTAFAIRRDVFGDVGPFEPEYGQFAPPLLSARMDQHGAAMSRLPSSAVLHDDSPEKSAHHDDTVDYVRGEMEARAANDPVFFEKYFGPSPFHGPDMILSARDARSMVRGLLVAAWRRPAEAIYLLKQAFALLPAALVSLRGRTRLLAALTRADEWLLMRLPLASEMQWKRFLAAHRRLIRTEQMLWIARNPLSSLGIEPDQRTWPAQTIGQHAAVGLHALEYLDDEVFRWTYPVFLLRFAPVAANGVLTLETRNVRPKIGLSDILVIVGGRILSVEEITLDGAGNIKLNIEALSPPVDEIDVVTIVRELHEPSTRSGPARRLGLPLFSISFECGDSSRLPPRP